MIIIIIIIHLFKSAIIIFSSISFNKDLASRQQVGYIWNNHMGTIFNTVSV